jgi:DNA segregation ATPase FtsK/SpoIIIE-like protein
LPLLHFIIIYDKNMTETLLILNTILLIAILGVVFAIYQKTKPRDAWNEFISKDGDELYDEAKKIVIEKQQASASMIQRRLRVGYARAARLLDMLEEEGVIGAARGAEPREVLKKQ